MARNLLDLVKQDLRFDEGRLSEVTADSKIRDKNGKIIPKFSVGVGHQVLPEDNLKPGDTISAEREELFFNKDVEKSIAAARRAMPDFDNLPFNFKRGMVNFMFQLGANADKKFPNAFKAINRGDLEEGVRELSTVGNGNSSPSKWLVDTEKRASRTIGTLNRGIAERFDTVRPDTDTRKAGTYEIEGPKPDPDDPGYPSYVSPGLPQAPLQHPGYGGLEGYGRDDVGAPPVAQYQPDLALHSGIFDNSIQSPDLGSPPPSQRGPGVIITGAGPTPTSSTRPYDPVQLTPFEAEMEMRRAFDANKPPPPTTAPTPYMQDGRLIDGRMFISGPNQPAGPARVVDRRR